ncbi:MAG: zinc-dependent metalloprotease [Polyangiaceae bacterium]
MTIERKWAAAAVVAMLAAIVPGCASERAPINRVQANALAKSFFVGDDLKSLEDDPEFYTATTVVDVPYGADQGFVFPGLVGRLSRVKWEITEHFLNARMTYEMIEGVDGHGAKRTNDGRVIASFHIESHFDIRRDYNPSTGEELNVIEENDTDRPWYERAYFRVDWSQNMIDSSRLWDPLQGDGYETEPLAYYVSDPENPDAPHFEPDEGYFDITNKLFLKPNTISIDGGDEVPACFYRGSLVVGATYPWGNCENSEITLRYSFRRVAQEGEPGFTDYEPVNWDGSRMNAFGIFTVDRLGWDRNYGIVDAKWRRFAQRYNIWQRSHSDVACATEEEAQLGCSPTRDGDFDCNGTVEPEKGEYADGTHDACEDSKLWGSQCDPLVGKCTLPLSHRRIRVVPWHYTVNSEDTVIYESTEAATWQWDAAMRMAVSSGRYAECVRTGTASLIGSPWQSQYTDQLPVNEARALCGEIFPIDQSHDDAELDAVRDVHICAQQAYDFDAETGPAFLDRYRDCVAEQDHEAQTVAAMDPIVVLCHNPINRGDHPACGEPGDVTRPGDIRYHQVNVWPTRQSVSPWGYGPSLGDPLTGEIISAGINVYNAVTDSAAQTFLDQIRWMNGELSVIDITSGNHVNNWVRAGDYYNAQQGPQMSKEDIDRRIAGMTGVDYADLMAAKQTKALPKVAELRGKFAEMARALDDEVLPPGTIPEDRSEFEERLERAKDTGVEADLMNPMWLQMAGVSPDMSPEGKRELGSPLRGMISRKMVHLYDQHQRALADQGQCLLGAPEPTGIPAEAKMMERKFPYDEDATAGEHNERLSRMWDYLRSRLNQNVILHEMGHTVGLRHNFVSSYDKYNYRPQYWQLRTKVDEVTQNCLGPVEDGEDCIGPRYYDTLTQDEIDNSIWTWQHSTVMDYAGDITQDMLNLGIYDMAATRMFYGNVVDVRADVTIDDPVGDAVRDLVDYPGYLFGQVVGEVGLVDVGHYTDYNEAFGLVTSDRCFAVDTDAPAWWDEDRWGLYDPLLDGLIVNGQRCARPPMDFVSWNDMVPDQIVVDFDDPDYFTPRRAVDLHDRPRVPYGFLTDNYADGWSPSSYRHDNGADMYEEVIFHSNLYENRHIFDNYRNGRVNFTVYGAYQRAVSRYHAKVENLTQGFAYTVDYILRNFAQTIGAPFSTVIAANTGEGTFLYDHAVAASVGFDHFVRVMTRPHSGSHYCNVAGAGCNANGDRMLRPAEDIVGGVPAGGEIAAVIPSGNLIAGDAVSYGGRPVNNDFQYGQGHWTFDYLNQAGSYYEKTFAIESMLNASYGAINFFRWDGIDARFRHVNFSDLFPEGFRRFVGAALTEDHQLIAPRMSSNPAGQPWTLPQGDTQADYPAQALAWVSFVPEQGPDSCRPLDGVLTCTDTLGVPIGQGSAETDAWFVDPQIGYEVQKFIVFWYYVYQAGKETYDWVDLARVYRLGSDVDPDYLPQDIVEWRDPESGLRYIAKRFGDESIFGKVYDRGIAAKMIQWANALTAQAYVLDPVEPFDPVTGRANVLFEADGTPMYVLGNCDDSKPCMQLRNYRGLLDFTRDTAARLGFPEPALQIFEP